MQVSFFTLFFSEMVKVANLIETPILWIHEFTLKWGCRHVFPLKSPLRHQRALGEGRSTQAVLAANRSGSTLPGHFPSKRDPGGPVCSAVRRGSSQPTRLSGENGGKSCRHPITCGFAVFWRDQCAFETIALPLTNKVPGYPQAW